MKLVTLFYDTNTVVNTNLTIAVGDGTDNDFLLGETSVASNWTVWTAFGTTSQKVYSAADTLDVEFRPGATNALSEMDRGEARFYFRKVRRP
jgi:hypothetical protein